MKRAAVVVIVAVLNAALFGITGSASSPQTSAQDAERARQAAVAKKAREIRPGTVVRIERTDGGKTEAILDEVLSDAIRILYVTRDGRMPATVPLAEIKKIGPLKGSALKKFAIGAGVSLAVVAGVCAVALTSLSTAR